MISALYMQHAGELIKFSTLRLNMLCYSCSKLTATYSQLHASGITYRMLVCRLLRLCFKSEELVRLACPRQVESYCKVTSSRIMLTQDLVSSSRHPRDQATQHAYSRHNTAIASLVHVDFSISSFPFPISSFLLLERPDAQ